MNTKRLSFALSKQLADKLDAIAKRDGRTRSEHIRFILQRSVDVEATFTQGERERRAKRK